MSNKGRFGSLWAGEPSAFGLRAPFGFIDQFENRGQPFLGSFALELLPLLRRQSCFQIFFYGKVGLPADNDPMTGKVSPFLQTICEWRFPAQPRAPYPELIASIHGIRPVVPTHRVGDCEQYRHVPEDPPPSA
jgi:hypothetical protein